MSDTGAQSVPSGNQIPDMKPLVDYLSKGRVSPQMPQVKPMGLGKQIEVQAAGMIPLIGQSVQQAVMQQRQYQVNDVAGKVKTLISQWENILYSVGGDQDKAKEAYNKDPMVQAIWQDKKFQKGMQKVFGTDLLSPDKQNTVFHEGFKKGLKLFDAEKKMKDAHAKARDAQSKQQSQPQQQQPQQQPSDLMSKLPQQYTPPDPKQAQETASTYKSLIEAAHADEPKTEFQGWAQAVKREQGEWPSAGQVEGHHTANKLSPLQDKAQEALDQMQAGDMDGARQTLAMVHEVANALHPDFKKNIWDYLASNDPKDKAAFDKYMQSQKELREAYGMGRAKYFYRPMMVNGQMQMKSGLDIFSDIQAGRDPGTAVGQFTTQQVSAFQRMFKEIGPKGTKDYNQGVMKNLYGHVKAWDNAGDRAIFAKAMAATKASGGSIVGDALETLRLVLNNVALDKLSPDGAEAYRSLNRLREVMGNARQASGLPATDYSSELVLGLLPGPMTPDSQFATKTLDQLDSTIKNMKTDIYGQNVLSDEPTTPTKKMSPKEFFDSLKPKGK